MALLLGERQKEPLLETRESSSESHKVGEQEENKRNEIRLLLLLSPHCTYLLSLLPIKHELMTVCVYA